MQTSQLQGLTFFVDFQALKHIFFTNPEARNHKLQNCES